MLLCCLPPPPLQPSSVVWNWTKNREVTEVCWLLLMSSTHTHTHTHTRTRIENTHTQETQQYVSCTPLHTQIFNLSSIGSCYLLWWVNRNRFCSIGKREKVCVYVRVCVFVCVSSYKLTVIRMTDRASRAWRTLLMLARLPEQSVCGTNLMLHWSSACLPGTVCVCVCVCVCVSVWFVCTFINCLTQTDWLLTLPFSPSFEFPPILFVLLLCLFSSFLTPVHSRSVEPVLKSGLDAAKSVFSYLIHLVFKDVIYIIMQHFLL